MTTIRRKGRKRLADVESRAWFPWRCAEHQGRYEPGDFVPCCQDGRCEFHVPARAGRLFDYWNTRLPWHTYMKPAEDEIWSRLMARTAPKP